MAVIAPEDPRHVRGLCDVHFVSRTISRTEQKLAIRMGPELSGQATRQWIAHSGHHNGSSTIILPQGGPWRHQLGPKDWTDAPRYMARQTIYQKGDGRELTLDSAVAIAESIEVQITDKRSISRSRARYRMQVSRHDQ